MVFCTKCSAELKKKTSICEHCGTAAAIQSNSTKRHVPGKGFGIASMAMGIFSVWFLLIVIMMFVSVPDPIANIGSFYAHGLLSFSIVPILSFIFSLVSMKRGYRNSISKSGLYMSIAGIIATVFVIIL